MQADGLKLRSLPDALAAGVMALMGAITSLLCPSCLALGVAPRLPRRERGHIQSTLTRGHFARPCIPQEPPRRASFGTEGQCFYSEGQRLWRPLRDMNCHNAGAHWKPAQTWPNPCEGYWARQSYRRQTEKRSSLRASSFRVGSRRTDQGPIRLMEIEQVATASPWSSQLRGFPIHLNRQLSGKVQ